MGYDSQDASSRFYHRSVSAPPALQMGQDALADLQELLNDKLSKKHKKSDDRIVLKNYSFLTSITDFLKGTKTRRTKLIFYPLPGSSRSSSVRSSTSSFDSVSSASSRHSTPQHCCRCSCGSTGSRDSSFSGSAAPSTQGSFYQSLYVSSNHFLGSDCSEYSETPGNLLEPLYANDTSLPSPHYPPQASRGSASAYEVPVYVRSQSTPADSSDYVNVDRMGNPLSCGVATPTGKPSRPPRPSAPKNYKKSQ